MHETHVARDIPGWVPYYDLASATIAAGLWYAVPQVGPWPLVLALSPWVLRQALAGRMTRRTAFELPLALFLLTAGLGVWAAYDRQAAWSKFWLIAGGVFLFYALANAERLAEWRVWLLASLSAGLAIYFLLAHNWDAYPVKFEAVARVGRALQAPFSFIPASSLNPNEVGGILAMAVPFSGLATFKAWQAVRRPVRDRKTVPGFAVGLVLLLLSCFGLAMSASRGAWLGLASALLAAGSWGFVGRWNRTNPQRRTWVFLSLVGLCLAGLLAVSIFWPAGLDALPGPKTGLTRLEFQRNSLVLVRDYPLIGAGLDGFEMLYSTYVMLIHVGFISHSHSLLLNVAVDQGLPGLLALIWMWFLFFQAVWWAILRPGKPKPAIQEPLELGAAALSIVVVLVHGLAEPALYGRAGVLVLFVPLAFAVPFRQRQSRAIRRWLAIGVLAVVALSAISPGWQGSLLSTIYSNLGSVHQSQAELGIYRWPEWPVQDAVRRAVDLSLPVAEFEQALALNPGNATANRRLGMIELSLGDYRDGLHHLEAAYAVESDSMATRQLLGEALIANGRLDEGRALWAGVNDEQMQLELRAFWYDHIGDSQRARWMRQAARGG